MLNYDKEKLIWGTCRDSTFIFISMDSSDICNYMLSQASSGLKSQRRRESEVKGGAAITMPRLTAGSKARPEGSSSLRIREAWGSTGNMGGQSTYLGPCQP